MVEMARLEHDPVVACSNCFRDHGLRATAFQAGRDLDGGCPSCRSLTGRKLSRRVLEEVCGEFFVQGSIFTGRGIFAPVIQVNDRRGHSDRFGTAELNADVAMLDEKHDIYCFYYGPPLWMFGKPSEENGQVVWDDADIDYILDNCNKVALESDLLYRIQRNLKDSEITSHRFCSPPEQFRKNYWRFDSENVSICYAALDVETCLHESRVTLQDDIFVATLAAQRPLHLLDLTTCETPPNTTSFNDPSIWLCSLLYDSGSQSYEVCRRLARHICDRRYDGFVYTSFFQQAAERPHKNVALFGTPIRSGTVAVRSINRVQLRNMVYDWGFGPLTFGAFGPAD